MDALNGYVARRNNQWTLALTIVAFLIAVCVEASVIFHVWINPIPRHSGFNFYMIPVMTVLPLILCICMQIGVRRALKLGNVTPKMGNSIELGAAVLMMVTYQAIGDLLGLIP